MANMLNALCQCPQFHGTGFCPIPTTEHRVPRWVTLPARAQVAQLDLTPREVAQLEAELAKPARIVPELARLARLTELKEA